MEEIKAQKQNEFNKLVEDMDNSDVSRVGVSGGHMFPMDITQVESGSSGPKENYGLWEYMGQEVGPIYFNQTCREVCQSRQLHKSNAGSIQQKKNKKKFVRELGKNANISSSYFACIAPMMDKNKEVENRVINTVSSED